MKYNDVVKDFEEGLGIKHNMGDILEVDYCYDKKEFQFYAYALCDNITGALMDSMPDKAKGVTERLNRFGSDRFIFVCRQHKDTLESSDSED